MQDSEHANQFAVPEELVTFLRYENFPIEELVDGGCYFKELADRFAVPLEMVTLTGLTIAGSMRGKHSWIDIGYRVPTCLFAVCGVEQIALAKPIVETMLDGFWREYDEEGLFPDQPTPMHIVNDLTTRGLLHAFAHSTSESLLYIAKSGAILRELCSRDQSSSHLDVELVGRCLNREFLNLPRNQKSSPAYYPFPSLSLMILAEREDFTEFLADFSNMPQELREACITYDSETSPGIVSSAPSQRSSSARFWERRTGELIGLQSSKKVLTLEASAEARYELASFQNGLRAMLSQIPQAHHTRVLSLPGLAVRLCAPIHSLKENRQFMVSAETARTAIKLIKYYAGRHFAVWTQAQRQMGAKTDQKEEEIMLSKIKLRAPLNRRTLFRSYRNQLAAIHEPTLARLFERGLIVLDEQGRIDLKSVRIT